MEQAKNSIEFHFTLLFERSRFALTVAFRDGDIGQYSSAAPFARLSIRLIRVANTSPLASLYFVNDLDDECTRTLRSTEKGLSESYE